MMNNTQLIAIHLPQFHPTAENNAWWGQGFTEWTNVTKALPLFNEHEQPKLPTDLGFYDLRLAAARLAQEALAKANGIHGFCYYHYWFEGKKLLHEPVEAKLANAAEDLPFMLCWANETWSRRWLGEEKEVLIKQTYSAEDDIAHAKYLASFFVDSRYIKIDGKPVFIVYRPNDFEDVAGFVERFKKAVEVEIGVVPFMVASNAHYPNNEQLLAFGFDYILNFRPQLGALPNAFMDDFSWNRWIHNLTRFGVKNGKYKLYDYKEALALMQEKEPATFDTMMPCVFVGWDNTPRRGAKGIIIRNNTKDLFKQELVRVIDKTKQVPNHAGFVFINAWNEWAEGNVLEPSNISGSIFLDAVKEVMDANRK